MCRKCHYRRTNIVCNGIKESLRMNLISPQVEALSLKDNDLDVIDERIMRRLRKLVRRELFDTDASVNTV